MHCPICDSDSDSVDLFNPCSTCQEVILDCLDGYPTLTVEPLDMIIPDFIEEDIVEVLEEGWDDIAL